MGVENFALTLQALARNAADNGALARGRRRASKRGSVSGRSQPSSVILDPVPEQDSSVDASQEVSADLTPGSTDGPMHTADASGTLTGTPMSGIPNRSSDIHAAIPGHVKPGEDSNGHASTTAPDEAARRPPADLSHVPTDLTPKEHGKRHQGSSDGHPVGEGLDCVRNCVVAALQPSKSTAEADMNDDMPACSSHAGITQTHSLFFPACAICEGVKRSGSSHMHLLRGGDSGIVLKGDGTGSVHEDEAPDSVSHLSWDDPSQPPEAHSLLKDAPRFAGASAAATTHSAKNHSGHAEGLNGADSPVGVLREALQKYEDGSVDVTVEGLARLQLRAQEYATRAGPTPNGRMKRRRKLQTMLATHGCKSADIGKGPATAPGKGADTDPVAASIVDDAHVSATALQLHQESSLKKSLRQCEAQRIMVRSASPWCVSAIARYCTVCVGCHTGQRLGDRHLCWTPRLTMPSSRWFCVCRRHCWTPHLPLQGRCITCRIILLKLLLPYLEIWMQLQL